MAILELSFVGDQALSQIRVKKWAQSAGVLQALQDWSKQGIQNPPMFQQIQRSFSKAEFPWQATVEKMVHLCTGQTVESMNLAQDEEDMLELCAPLAERIVFSSMFLLLEILNHDPAWQYQAAVHLLVTAFDDMFRNRRGYFRTLVVLSDPSQAGTLPYQLPAEFLISSNAGVRSAGVEETLGDVDGKALARRQQRAAASGHDRAKGDMSDTDWI